MDSLTNLLIITIDWTRNKLLKRVSTSTSDFMMMILFVLQLVWVALWCCRENMLLQASNLSALLIYIVGFTIVIGYWSCGEGKDFKNFKKLNISSWFEYRHLSPSAKRCVIIISVYFDFVSHFQLMTQERRQSSSLLLFLACMCCMGCIGQQLMPYI